MLKCLDDETREGRSYATSPQITTPVTIHSVDFGTLKIAVDDVSGTGVKIDFTLDYTFTWDDNRLAFSPCRMVIDSMLSSKGAEPSVHVESYWRPNLFIGTGEEPARRPWQPLPPVTATRFSGIGKPNSTNLSLS